MSGLAMEMLLILVPTGLSVALRGFHTVTTGKEVMSSSPAGEAEAGTDGPKASAFPFMACPVGFCPEKTGRRVP